MNENKSITRIEKEFNTKTQRGTTFGGVKIFSPSLSNRAAASSSVKPYKKSIEIKKQERKKESLELKDRRFVLESDIHFFDQIRSF